MIVVAMAPKHWVIGGGIVLVVVVSALNGPSKNMVAPSAHPTPAVTPAVAETVTKNDLIFESVKSAKVLSDFDVKDRWSTLPETFTYSTNGGWTPTDTRAAPFKDAFIVEIVVDYAKMARGFLIDTCETKGVPRRCSQDEVTAKIAEYVAKPCAYLGGKYGLGHFSFHDAMGREIYRTDKWGGQRVIHCEDKGDEVVALLGPAIERPVTLSLSESGSSIPLK